MTFVHRNPLFFVPVNKSLYAPHTSAPGKAGVPPGRHSGGSARRRRLNRQSSAACLANIRRARSHPVQHKPARAREPRVEKSNGMTPVASEKRCISQPVARRPDPDGPPWPQEPPQLTDCLRNKRPDARMGHRTAPAHGKTYVLSSRTERLGVVPKIRTIPSGPLLSEHQHCDRVVPAAARGEPHAVGVGPPRERRAGRVLYQRRCNGGMLRGPLVHRFPSCLSWSTASAVHLKAFFARHLPAVLSVLVSK